MPEAAHRHASRLLAVAAVLACVCLALAGPLSAQTPGPIAAPVDAPADGLDEDLFREQVSAYLGVPYRWGGSNRKGMDCSGFAKHVYAKVFGVELPHKAAQQYRLSFLKSIPHRDQLKTGDLVFFARGKGIDHVGIYLSEGRFIHAARSRGVNISSLDQGYWSSRFVGSRRLKAFEDGLPAGRVGTEGLVEVSLDEATRLELAFASFLPLQGSPASEWPYDPWSGPTWPFSAGTRPPEFSLEFGYNRALLSDAWVLRVSALLERSAFDGIEEGFGPGRARHLPFAYGIEGDPFYRGGLKVASSVDLFGGLRLTPSLTYIGYDERSGWDAVAQSILGMEALMISPASRTRMSLALHYVGFQDPVTPLLRVPPIPEALNVSYSVHYGLMKDLLHVSLLGRHSLNGPPGAGAGIRAEPGPHHDLFFAFDFSY